MSVWRRAVIARKAPRVSSNGSLRTPRLTPDGGVRAQAHRAGGVLAHPDGNGNGATAIGEEISPQVSSTVGAMDEEGKKEEEEEDEDEEDEESAMDELVTFESQQASNATSPFEDLMV